MSVLLSVLSRHIQNGTPFNGFFLDTNPKKDQNF